MKKLLALLVVGLGLFSSTFALKTPNIMGWTETTGADLNTNYMIIQSGQTQNRISLLNMAGIFSGGATVTGDFYPFSGNDPTKPIYGDFYMAIGSGSLNISIETGVSIGGPMLADLPVITPTAYLPGFGYVKIMLTKGRQFFMGEPGANTQMYFANSTGNIGRQLNSDDATAKFVLQPFTGGATAGLMGYTQWNVDGTIQAGNTGIITAINAGPDETYVTKGWVNNQGIRSIDATKIYTNNTGVIGFQVGNAQALNQRAIAMGDGAYASNDSIAFGTNNIVTGMTSVGLGAGNTVSAGGSVVVGHSNKGYQYRSQIFGGNNTTYDMIPYFGGSHIFGSENKVRSYDTFVMGRLNNSTGESNVIIGIDTNFSGQRVYGFGQSLLSTGMDKYIFGQYNLPTSGSMFEFGIGNAGLRKNAMTIMSNGNVNITGYTQLGGDAPSIKMKLYTGTTPSSEGATTGFAHGISSVHKIVAVDVFISESIYRYQPNSHISEAKYTYDLGGARLYINLDGTSSALILNAPYTVLITYME